MFKLAMRGLMALLLSGEVFAAALTAAPEWNADAQRAALQLRQTTSLSYTSILGYYSVSEETHSGVAQTICKPFHHVTPPFRYSIKYEVSANA
jgi:hypothetical protein